LALRTHPGVRFLRYPGLPDDPSHEIANRQMKRFGGIVAIELESAAAVHAMLRNSNLLVSSTSFGGIHSSVDRRARWGDPVGEGFARISAGIEDTDDLIADIDRALG
jgi:cystathionine gamma-lyase